KVYGAGIETSNGSTNDVYSPQFPCCGSSSTSGAQGGVYSVPANLPANGSVNSTLITTTSSPNFLCDELKNCLVGNANTLYYMAAGDQARGTLARIAAITK